MHLTSGNIMINPHWWHFFTHLEREEGTLLLEIYGIRVAALIAVTCLWIIFTLATGIFTVVIVILVGAAVGNAHHLLRRMPCRAHHSSALLLTICGGISANALAGLALFSTQMGIEYWQVLASRRLPEDLPVLAQVFSESFRPEDALFYLLAAVVVVFSARNLKRWRKSPPPAST